MGHCGKSEAEQGPSGVRGFPLQKDTGHDSTSWDMTTQRGEARWECEHNDENGDGHDRRFFF